MRLKIIVAVVFMITLACSLSKPKETIKPESTETDIPQSAEIEIQTEKKVEAQSSNVGSNITLTFTFDYMVDTFPHAITMDFHAKYIQKIPFVSIMWKTPDGREIRVADFSVRNETQFDFAQDQKLRRRLAGEMPTKGLFIADPNASTPLKGKYQVVVTGITFEKDSDIDAELVISNQP